MFFTPGSLQDDRSKDDFADTARLICIAYQVPCRSADFGVVDEDGADDAPQRYSDRNDSELKTAVYDKIMLNTYKALN